MLIVNTLSVVLAIGINLVSVILDIVVLSIYFPAKLNATEEFSAVMAIFNLFLR